MKNIPKGLIDDDQEGDSIDGEEVAEFFSTEKLPTFTNTGILNINKEQLQAHVMK
jgi:hypothetical protein